jgi:hypothetical protein
MLDTDTIRKLIEHHGINGAGSIISSPDDPTHYYIPIVITSESAVHQKLKTLKNILHDQDINLNFLVIHESNLDIEVGIRASLITSFPDHVRNVFLSSTGEAATVWIDQKVSLSKEQSAAIGVHVQKIAELHGIKKCNIGWIREGNVATKLELLASIRLLAPVDCAKLMEYLKSLHFDVPSEDWVNRKFDLLRKEGFLVRRADRRYVLTIQALKSLGTQKNRNSPDLRRLLALARGAM